MRLTDLNPRWVAGPPGRTGIGLSFDCPVCSKKRIHVFFQRPIDGGPLTEYCAQPERVLWANTGDSFDTLTLSPSVDASGFGHWHGFITNGNVTEAGSQPCRM